MFYEMPLKPYFMKCSETNISQCILALKSISIFLLSIKIGMLRLPRGEQRCPVKKVFLETLQNSHENNCVIAFFLIKLQT